MFRTYFSNPCQNETQGKLFSRESTQIEKASYKQENIKSHRSVPSILGMWWKMWALKDLFVLKPMSLLVAAHIASLLGWLHMQLADFLSWISTFLKLQTRRFSAAFSDSLPQLPTLPSQGHLAWTLKISVESKQNPPSSHKYYTLYDGKTNAFWMTPALAAPMSQRWVLLIHGCSNLCIPEWHSEINSEELISQ